MIGDHGRGLARFSGNGTLAFDGISIHDSALNGGGPLSDLSIDQFFASAFEGDEGDNAASHAKHDHVGDSAASGAGPAIEALLQLDPTDLFGGAGAPAIDPAAQAADGLDHQDFAALFFGNDDAFVFSTDDSDGRAIGGVTLSLDLPHDQPLDLSLEVVGGFGAFQDFLPGAPSGWDAPVSISVSFTAPSFEHGDAPPPGAPDAGGEITLLDMDFFAKGGNGKPGGDTSGSGTGSGVDTNYYSGDGNGSLGYDIWIEFKGSGWTVELQQAFINAADYFTTVIKDDIGGGGLYRGKVIDDLYVTAELKAIDGTGGILGQAGPTAVWTANYLTAAGQMQFDVADAADYLKAGLWDDIVTHEMMHVLGFGSLWNYGDHVGLVTDYKYTGDSALYAYNKFLGLDEANAVKYIPVENDGGSGTAGAHWDEGALDNELMTGWIDNGNYLSEFSVMSLADLGYTVEYQSYPLAV